MSLDMLAEVWALDEAPDCDRCYRTGADFLGGEWLCPICRELEVARVTAEVYRANN